MAGVTPFWEWARRNARIKNEYVTGGLAEFGGTFIVGLFAVGAGAQAFLTEEFIFKPLWGGVLGLMFAIIIFGGVSGAHVNPAVTLALAISGKCSWYKLPIYWFAQFFGAYLGAGLACALYVDAIENDYKCGGVELKHCPIAAGIFSPGVSDKVGLAFLDQVIGTAILLMVIFAALDTRNMKIPTYMYGFLFAMTVFGVNCAFGFHAGGVLNPARDIGPRLMALSIGFKSTGIFATTTDAQYWLAPFFGPLVGAVLGAVLYIFLVGAHLEADDETAQLKASQAPPASQYGYNAQGPRPDWRNTDLRKMPQNSMGPPSQGGHYGQNGMNNNNNNNQFY